MSEPIKGAHNELDVFAHEWTFRDSRFLVQNMFRLLGFVAPGHRRRAMNLVLTTLGRTIVPKSDSERARALLLALLYLAVGDTQAGLYPHELLEMGDEEGYLQYGIETMVFED